MRMSGYASRVTSMSWTADGDWLATSGAPQLILWPFQGKDGPMGKEPRVLAPAEHRVEVVASHPKDPIVAVGRFLSFGTEDGEAGVLDLA
jgi:hypothetical protein